MPTPIDDYKRPDLTPLVKASESVGKVLKKGDVVVYESTVYPGCTEEVCVPILERESGLKFNATSSPATAPSASTPATRSTASPPSESDLRLDARGRRFRRPAVSADHHRRHAQGLQHQVAEAAKVIENTQRDVNIALINELALIFNRLGIDTEEVLNAAGSKWNFLPFRPGLVGGHCIGVDPYYLTHKAQEIGYHPEMILAGRRLNDNMALLRRRRDHQADGEQAHPREGRPGAGARHHLQGELPRHPQLQSRRTSCASCRRTAREVDIYDPWADDAECRHEYGLVP